MALYRTISMSFWTDSKVTDDFSAEDRFFYLYLMTNPHTNLCGCYEISIRHMANETGYSRDSVENLLKRFEQFHKVIAYSPDTKEVLLINWHKYNWTKSEKFRKPLLKEIEKIKNESFRDYLSRVADGEDIRYGIDTTSIDTSVTNTNTITNTDSNTIAITEDNISEQETMFETLWALYPKKRGKTAVSKKSKKEILKVGYDHMARAIDRYKKEVAGKDEQYILMGSTFFNGRYQDYLDENYIPPRTYTENMAQPFLDFINHSQEGVR